jgi:ribosomal protein L11 methylase PrmA
MIKANLKRLAGIISGLDWSPQSSTWSEYAQCDHVVTQRQAKSDFVTGALSEGRRHLVWDLGANDGHFSRLASRFADLVIAADADQLVVDRVFAELSAEGPKNILPLLFDLSNPSPGLGWRGRERRPLEERGRPDLVLMLAVLHHLVVAGNLPLSEVVDWLASLRSEIILEWVPPTDPMAKRLAVNKREGEIHSDYNEESLRSLLADRFSTNAEKELEGRILFHLSPR